MALTTTTLSSACAVGDTSIVVASATGLAANYEVLIDGEVMLVDRTYVSGTTVPVRRGLNGTYNAAHPASAKVTFGASSDQAWGTVNAPQTVAQYPVAGKARQTMSYSASGAITLPLPGNDMVAILNGTGTLAMTVADPGELLDGSRLVIVGNGKSASTVTFASGLGNAGSSYDVITFQNAGNVGFEVIAAGGYWVALNAPITGTSTALSVAVG